MDQQGEEEPTLGERLRDMLTPEDAGPAVREYFERFGREVDEKGGATIDIEGLGPALAEDLPEPDSDRWRQ